MTEQTPPVIEFPCDYPIKVIGDAADDFEHFVAAVIRRHDPSFQAEGINCQPSRNGRFTSVRLTLRATGQEQLQALFVELKASGRVHMVL